PRSPPGGHRSAPDRTPGSAGRSARPPPRSLRADRAAPPQASAMAPIHGPQVVAIARARRHARGMADEVAVLRLEGGKANAMTPTRLGSLERMVDGFERGPAAVAVLTGYDRFFSGGL